MVKIKQDALSDAAAAAMAAANAATGTSTTAAAKPLSATDFAKAPFDNSTLGLKGPNGALLPRTITVAQAQTALQNTKYNGTVVDTLKTTIAGQLPSVFKNAGVTSLSPTGSVTPKELSAIMGVLQNGYANSASNTPLNFNQIIADTQSGAYAGSSITSTINSKSLDQPNIEASKATINSIFSDMLGRTATDAEINKYSTQYLDYAAKNPTSQTSGTYNYGYIPTPSGGQRLQKQSTNETSVQNNLDEQAFITNKVMQGTDYNTFSAANTAYGFLQNLAKQSAGTE